MSAKTSASFSSAARPDVRSPDATRAQYVRDELGLRLCVRLPIVPMLGSECALQLGVSGRIDGVRAQVVAQADVVQMWIVPFNDHIQVMPGEAAGWSKRFPTRDAESPSWR
jgi:hypothetical protein